MAIPPVSGLNPALRVARKTSQDDSNTKDQSQGTAVEERDVQVEISKGAERLRAQSEILKAFFGNTEAAVAADQELFERAGKSEYMRSIESPSDLSPEATAERILGGIKGYIYGAFRLAHPEASAEDFERFQDDVMRGFKRGMGEAKEIIEGLAALTPELAAGIDRTEELVRQGMDEFFETESERYRAA